MDSWPIFWHWHHFVYDTTLYITNVSLITQDHLIASQFIVLHQQTYLTLDTSVFSSRNTRTTCAISEGRMNELVPLLCTLSDQKPCLFSDRIRLFNMKVRSKRSKYWISTKQRDVSSYFTNYTNPITILGTEVNFLEQHEWKNCLLQFNPKFTSIFRTVPCSYIPQKRPSVQNRQCYVENIIISVKIEQHWTNSNRAAKSRGRIVGEQADLSFKDILIYISNETENSPEKEL